MEIVAISADSAEDSRGLEERIGALGFPLLSDPGVKVAERYGVAMKGEDIAVPSMFVVMADRRVAWAYVGENPADRPAVEQMLEQVDAALGE